MAWKTMDVHEQLVRFVVAATQKARPFRALCAEYEISPPTGYLWFQRYQDIHRILPRHDLVREEERRTRPCNGFSRAAGTASCGRSGRQPVPR